VTAPRGTFDRVRSRAPGADAPGSAVHDNEGKRALFSASAPEAADPPGGMGSVTVECGRCHERTVLSPTAALRAALPSVTLSLGIGRGDRESTVGVSRRRYGTFMRCPACGRASWTRVTVRL
jgi:hypothetical protein